MLLLALVLTVSRAHAEDATVANLRAAAEKGDALAQLCLGNHYYLRRHKDPADEAEAQKWFQLSAAQNNAQAEERLGQLYYSGEGEPQDYAQAAVWFRKAADNGSRQAQERLARMYRLGQGVVADPGEARKWSELATHTPASTPCITVPVVLEGTQSLNGAPLPDYPDLRRAAEHGDAVAAELLAEKYYDERVRDPARDEQVLKWLHRAAAAGNPQAQDRLGWIYARGNGVPQDYTEAANWYRRAAEQGNLDAMTRLGNLYLAGQGVPRDRDAGRSWINRASEISSRPQRQREEEWLAAVTLGVVSFAAALVLLQRGSLAGWRRTAAACFVHVVGIALVLNTLNTYGLPQLLFPKCSSGGFLSSSCWNYKDPGVRQLATELHDWQMVNLVWRFMAMVGLVFDVLAVWYLVYLLRPLIRRRRAGQLTSKQRPP